MRKFHAKTRKTTVARNKCPEGPVTLREFAAVELTEAILLDQKRILPAPRTFRESTVSATSLSAYL